MFATTQMMGMDTGFPDVCKTPTPGGPVPMTYPNGTYEVNNKVATSSPKNTAGSKATNSIGDEAGTMKGVVSSITMGNLLGNAPLLMRLVDKAHAKGFKVMVTVKAEGKAVMYLQGTMQFANNITATQSRTYHARSGTEGMEWLVRCLG